MVILAVDTQCTFYVFPLFCDISSFDAVTPHSTKFDNAVFVQ